MDQQGTLEMQGTDWKEEPGLRSRKRGAEGGSRVQYVGQEQDSNLGSE